MLCILPYLGRLPHHSHCQIASVSVALKGQADVNIETAAKTGL